MSTVTGVVIVIIVLVVLGAAGFVAWSQNRRRNLQKRFGPEYDRVVETHESTREAEQELLARQKRHDELQLRDLEPEARDRYRAEWKRVQENFVDAPESAVTEADHLLVRVMSERGYPTEGFEQQAADLSVEHAATIDRYRTANEISTRAAAKQASTEDLRQAMVHYRALFTELVGDNGTAEDERTLTSEKSEKSENEREARAAEDEREDRVTADERAAGTTADERAAGTTADERAAGTTVDDAEARTTADERAAGTTADERAAGTTVDDAEARTTADEQTRAEDEREARATSGTRTRRRRDGEDKGV
jgi:hypothetical protein